MTYDTRADVRASGAAPHSSVMAPEAVEHEAGRALDALVAERVMGWRDVQLDAYVPYGRDACGTTPDGKGGFYDSGRAAVPAYSTNIKAAWEVVEKLGAMGYLPEVALLEGKDWRWRATMVEAESRSGYFRDAETAPLAICRAALKAVEAAE